MIDTQPDKDYDGSTAFIFGNNLCAIDIKQNPGETIATLEFFFTDDVDEDPREATPEEIYLILEQPEAEEFIWNLLLVTSELSETWGYVIPQVFTMTIASNTPWAIA